ncbi:Ig-like domain-containing protein [Actinophytocola sp.]|uniref:Ig-like domain-containing protein n=1 Tax=Actinophytocola sp. TaxID=1872138 RepID=UPI003899B742
MIDVSFATPAPGESVGNTFTITGTWFDDGQVDTEGHDQFGILQILVDFGANRFPKVKATVGDGTWSATGSLPTGVRHGDVITLAFTANILATSSSGDQPGEIDVSDTRQVVVEQTPPQVTIDSFPSDRTVNQLPFRLLTLSGHASDSSGVTTVQYSIDGGPRQNMDTAVGDPTNLSWTKANLDFGAGDHTIAVFATDFFGNEASVSAPLTVRLNEVTPPPPPTPVDISFTPTFRHTNWVNNVDPIVAGGPNGFNVRYDAIDSDLRQVSTVVDQVNVALKTAGIPAGVQLLTPGLDLITRLQPIGAGWNYDENGLVHPDATSGSANAVMDLTLPEKIKLVSFRATGFFSGPPARLNIALRRIPLTGPTQVPDTLATISPDANTTNPYDLTTPVTSALATVDNGAFRYFIQFGAASIQASPAVSVAAVQLAYVAT